mmetsp:Transcript_59310/g.89480  ORF Transcript_59310/g.89480 Transcript_59310/m.89480 type:complete len:93 (+) Transcript_59310:240-518(+)
MPVFDHFHMSFAARRDKSDCGSLSTGPSGAANPVDEIGCGSRQIVVHHDGQSDNVQSTTGDIRGEQDSNLSAFEIRQASNPSVLVQLSMQFH